MSEHKRGNFTYENAHQIKSGEMRILVRQRCIEALYQLS
jgi:hypothetical protein